MMSLKDFRKDIGIMLHIDSIRNKYIKLIYISRDFFFIWNSENYINKIRAKIRIIHF